MASVPGTSGSSSGGNQPPNKRSKMDTGNSSNPDSDLDLLHSDQPGSVSSMTKLQPECLQCPVCQEYPRMQVYQCDDGHIICNECISKLTRCPVCAAIYPPEKIRSRVAETVLEGMSFNCSFRNVGCQAAHIPRNRRTAHEIQCEHNPSQPGFKCSGLFEATGACQVRIDPNAIIQDPQHAKDVISHLKRLRRLLYEKTKIGEKRSFRIRLLTSSGPRFDPYWLFQVVNGTTHKIIGYYVIILRQSMEMGKNLSCAVVGLNSAPVDVNSGAGNRHSDKITVTISIKAKTEPNKVEKDGNGCVPNLSWTIKSTYLDEWEEFMMMPIEDRPPISFSVPLNFLDEYYVQEDGRYRISISFGPLDD